jgi:hypothetical protein
MSAQDQHNKEKQDSPFVAPAKWRQGTFGTILTMPWPWPPARDLILSHANLPLGTLTLVAQRDARVRLELCASELNRSSFPAQSSCRMSTRQLLSPLVGGI